jgi:hypothetical protein
MPRPAEYRERERRAFDERAEADAGHHIPDRAAGIDADDGTGHAAQRPGERDACYRRHGWTRRDARDDFREEICEQQMAGVSHRCPQLL